MKEEACEKRGRRRQGMKMRSGDREEQSEDPKWKERGRIKREWSGEEGGGTKGGREDMEQEKEWGKQEEDEHKLNEKEGSGG